jgi:DNA-directed RNA polymerase specialized sigma24 family protein
MEPSRQRRSQQRLPNDRVQQLVADYAAGATMKEVAARYGLHRTTVAGHLRRAGVELRRQGVPDEKLTEMVCLYGEGWSLQQLGERYDCSADTVRLALLKARVTMRRPWERA